MIGKVVYPGGEIVLPAKGPIQCSDAAIQPKIEKLFQHYQRSYSPAQGSFGADFLAELAEELGGEVELAKQPSKPGMVY